MFFVEHVIRCNRFTECDGYFDHSVNIEDCLHFLAEQHTFSVLYRGLLIPNGQDILSPTISKNILLELLLLNKTTGLELYDFNGSTVQS